MRTLGLDIGEKRIGLALSDVQGMLATPYATIARGNGKAEREILSLVKRHGIKTIVVGIPLGENGEKGDFAIEIENFCRRLKRRCAADFRFIDESFSTIDALSRLQESGKNEGMSRKKGLIDAASASIILQRYLESRE